MRTLLSLLCGLSLLSGPHALAEKLVLVAGGGEQRGDAPAAQCRLHEPFGVEFAADGTMWIVEMVTSNRLLKIDPNGVLHVVADNGKGAQGDGEPASKAQFNGMHNLAIAPNGDIYLADSFGHRVRKIDVKTGKISTFAGTGRRGFSGDGGPAAEADFSTIIQIALDSRGESLYLADIGNKRIRRVNIASGIVETIAGNGKKGVPVDGTPAKESPLVDPRAVVAAVNGFYILERDGHALRFVDASGKIRTVAGTGQKGLSGDGGPALQATLNGPKHLCMAPDGSVIIADAENHVVRKFDPATGTITRVAGTGKKGTAGLDGEPQKAELNRPHGVTFGPDGSLFIVDAYNDRIVKIVR